MKRKDILFLSIATFIVVVVWISSNLYHKWATSTISEDVQKQLTPINPSFDTATIDKLKLRQKVNPVYTLNQTVTATPTQTVTPSPTESVALPLAEPTIEPVAEEFPDLNEVAVP